MWDTEKCDNATLPLYVAAAILEAQQWLQGQQHREGLIHADHRGWSWTLSGRLAGRHFAVAQYPSRMLGGSSDALLILAYTDKRWNESREATDIPSAETAKHPLLWFAAIPWVAHLSRHRDHLVLFCPEHPIPGGKPLPPWTLTLPVSLRAWHWMYADYLRSQSTDAGARAVSRFALGDGQFVPALGFDVEWGSIVDVPVRIDPLIREMQMSQKEPEPLLVPEDPDAR